MIYSILEFSYRLIFYKFILMKTYIIRLEPYVIIIIIYKSALSDTPTVYYV